MTAAAPLEVDGVWQGFRPPGSLGHRSRDVRWVLRDVTFTVPSGQCFGVIGGNGSGKTTLLQTIAGVLAPLRGSVRSPGSTSSLVDLAAGFHRELTGIENATLGGILLGMSRRVVRERLDDILAFADLGSDAETRPLRTYSSGMVLRLGFSLVVHTHPDVLLVDEVLAVGDEAFQERCLARIDEMRRDGCRVVVVSHDLDLIRKRCDRVVVLDRGTPVVVDDPDDAVERYLELLASGRVATHPTERGPRPGALRRKRLL